MIALFIAFVSLQTALPSPGLPMVTIEQLKENVAPYRHRRVQIRGWIRSRCQPLDCVLSSEPHGPGSLLSIEQDGAFDRLVEEWAPAQVVLEAKVGPNTGPCIDRCGQLRDVRLIRILREGLPPRN